MALVATAPTTTVASVETSAEGAIAGTSALSGLRTRVSHAFTNSSPDILRAGSRSISYTRKVTIRDSRNNMSKSIVSNLSEQSDDLRRDRYVGGDVQGAIVADV